MGTAAVVTLPKKIEYLPSSYFLEDDEPPLNFRKFKVALNPMYKIFLNFAKSYNLSCLLKFYNKKKFHRTVLEIEALKAETKGVLADHSVAMVTYCVSKIIPTCSPVIGQFFDTMIVVASIDKMWLETFSYRSFSRDVITFQNLKLKVHQSFYPHQA